MIRTLVVDDDFMTASLHASYVGRVDGFEVVGEAHSGAEALRLVEALKPDLLLLDIYLPDLDGLEVARRLRTSGAAAVDVIAVTAAKDVHVVRTAMQMGIVNYLVKPFPFATIRERLERYRAVHGRLERTHEADQDEIDRIYALMRPDSGVLLPKGISRGTLKLVAEAVEVAGGEVSIDEVAERAGVGRATARRYLEHLRHAGALELTPRFGRTGRPSHRYRRIARDE